MTNVEAPIHHDHAQEATHDHHEHGPSCQHGHEEHSHEALFSKEAKEAWGARFDSAIQIGFLLSTKAENYTAEKRLGMETAIQKLEFSPDPRALTPAEKEMNKEFDNIIQSSLHTIKEAPEVVIAQTALQLRKVRFNENDQKNIQEKIAKVTPTEHVHIHADEKTLTYDVHNGETYHAFTYSEILQIVALHKASDIKGSHDPKLHTIAHALKEAGITLANKRSADNPHVMTHPYALKAGETLQDFEHALKLGDTTSFQLEDMHELGGIHGNISMNENGELTEEVCADHAAEVDEQLENIQQETAQEFQQAVQEQSLTQTVDQQAYNDSVLDAPPGDPSSTFLEDEPRAQTTTDASPSVTPSSSPLSTAPATTEKRSRSIPPIARSNPPRRASSFESALPSSVASENTPIPTGSEDRQPIQINETTGSPVLSLNRPAYRQNESGIASSIPSLLQAEATKTTPIRVRSVNDALAQPSSTSTSELTPIEAVPNSNQRVSTGREASSVESPTPSLQLRFTDASTAIRQDVIQAPSSSSEGSPILLVNPNTNQDATSSDAPIIQEDEAYEDAAPVVAQAVEETPEEPQSVIPSASTDTEGEDRVAPPIDEISSFSRESALPSAPRPQRPPQDPKNTFDTTRTVTKPVAVERKAPDIVIGSTLSEALEVSQRQVAVAQIETVQEQKEEQVALTQAVGVQKNEQATVKDEAKAEAGSGTTPAVSRTNEVTTRQESSETEVTVKTATGTSVRVRQSGISSPTRQGRSTNTETTETTQDVKQATEKGTNEEVQKVQATGTPVQITTPQRTQSTTTRTTASVASSQGAKLELQVDARHIDHNNPVNTRMFFDQILKQLAA